MNERRKILVPAVVVGILFLIFLFFSRLNRPFETDSGSRPVMGTFARVVIVADDKKTAQNCIEAAFEQIRRVDELMSYHNSDSEVSLVNANAFENSVRVSSFTYEVIKKSIEFSRLTEGAFDVTVGPLVDLWKKAADTNTVPDEEQLRQVRSKVGYDKLVVNDDEQSVRFAVEGMKIDLGGIAKGYAVDKAIEAISRGGAIGGLVDIGGDIRCFGKPAEGKDYWLVGLQNPDLEGERKVLLTLGLSDNAITTSGDYQRFVIVGGRRYSHIINQKTGWSATGLSSVTIITDNAADADAYSTAISVIGEEKGLQFIETISETEAIIISPPPDYEIKKTSGADMFVK